ncbi:MAG: hypothetical protein Q4C55_00010 [Eubacterium sp.]|nr:hypothetical protein [Eubacterium sp.]
MIREELKSNTLRIITEMSAEDGTKSKRTKVYGEIAPEADNQSIYSVCRWITGLQTATPVDYQKVSVVSLTEEAA